VTAPAVRYACTEHVATITLNRPDNRNSMTPDLLDGVREAVARAGADPDVRCVVVTGSGKSFCAGADFRTSAMAEGPREGTLGERQYAMYEPFLSILDLEVPVVAAMNGHAIGGGLGLALVCDVRIANREARYGANFVRLGLHPGMATTFLLPRLVGFPRASELLLTGRLVDGETAAAIGLANHAVAPGDVLVTAMEIAREVAAAAPLAVRWTKRSLHEGLAAQVRAAARSEAELQGATTQTEDFREGAAALLGKREPRFTGR
jgi:enoyl-CoA hydratase/carnithine racemase